MQKSLIVSSILNIALIIFLSVLATINSLSERYLLMLLNIITLLIALVGTYFVFKSVFLRGEIKGLNFLQESVNKNLKEKILKERRN